MSGASNLTRQKFFIVRAKKHVIHVRVWRLTDPLDRLMSVHRGDPAMQPAARDHGVWRFAEIQPRCHQPVDAEQRK